MPRDEIFLVAENLQKNQHQKLRLILSFKDPLVAYKKYYVGNILFKKVRNENLPKICFYIYKEKKVTFIHSERSSSSTYSLDIKNKRK